MRKLIIIALFSAGCNAQTFTPTGDLILPKQQVQKIADTLRKHEKCEPAKRELMAIIRKQDINLTNALDILTVLRSERDNLFEESLKLHVDNEKYRQQKPFSFGVYAGYDPFSQKASAGISLQYAIFIFRL